jgi:hypothetical protein
MVDLGVLIEDDGNESVWKLDDPAVLRAEARCPRHIPVPALSSLPCSANPQPLRLRVLDQAPLSRVRIPHHVGV